ncbi:MAG: peptidylprolyl isomerase [Chitinophagales bacterium]|jgi:peptidyl-prolyl cis-trans isomerase SurA|nr:peptidylprolyl isomerase [Chitinophagales bacterium]
MKSFQYIVLLISFVIASAALHAQTTNVDKVIAIVGDNVVLLSEIEAQYQQMQTQSPDLVIDPSEKCAIFNNMLLEKLFLSQAQLDSVTASTEEVESELDRRIKYFISIFGSKEKLEEYYGKSILELKDDFRDDIEKQLVADKMKGKVFAGLKVSPAEVKAFFERIPEDSVPYFNSELELSQIVMFPKVNDAEKKRCREKIEDIRKEILQGKDFSIAAIQYSEDPGSYLDGGNLGWVARGEMVPAFEAVIFKIKENELSEVFESDFGFHIALVTERRGDKVKASHILVKPKILKGDMAIVKETMDSLQHQLAVDSISWREAVNIYSEDEMTKSVGGAMTNTKTGTTFFEKADIDGTLIFTIDRMKVGEESEVLPFAAQAPTGEMKQGYRIILLKSETKPHKANLEEDYSKIQTAAKAEKQQRIMEEWLLQHKGKNFVKIDESMNYCPQTKVWLTN